VKIELQPNYVRRHRTRGFSLIELLIVVFVVMVVAAIAVPNILLAVSNIRLRASAGDLSGLLQQARILSAKNNTTYSVLYAIRNGAQIAFVDLNGDGVWENNVTLTIGGVSVTMSEPMIEFSGNTVAASGTPSGSGQPTAYVLVGDSGTGSYDNTNTLGFTSRGLPCNYDTTTTPATCTTPPAKYFVYYLTNTRVGAGGAGWAAVVVTKGGRTKIVTWNGGAWN
jgi:prepilin-type N-terminal cleavage/methylation domain-containing protein